MASKEAVSYIPEQMGIGHFDRLLEKFDPEGDCERTSIVQPTENVD